MSWETRGNREYYFSARREGGRVVKEYYGSGKVAELTAEMHGIERADRDMQREVYRGVIVELADLDEPLDTLAELTNLLVRAALVSAGYRQHKRGEWRKSRARRCQAG